MEGKESKNMHRLGSKNVNKAWFSPFINSIVLMVHYYIYFIQYTSCSSRDSDTSSATSMQVASLLFLTTLPGKPSSPREWHLPSFSINFTVIRSHRQEWSTPSKNGQLRNYASWRRLTQRSMTVTRRKGSTGCWGIRWSESPNYQRRSAEKI